MIITPKQIRAARAILDWTAKDLANRVRMSPATVSMIENEQTDGSIASLTAIRDALMSAGIEFLDGNGLRQRSTGVVTFEGRDGFAAFRQDVLALVRTQPCEICVSNVDERNFAYWGEGDINASYYAEMEKIKTYSFRILIKEGDNHFTASNYATYKALPSDLFGEIPFYIYGHKVAIVSFENNEFNAFVINHPSISAFYRRQFDFLWGKAKALKVKK